MRLIRFFIFSLIILSCYNTNAQGSLAETVNYGYLDKLVRIARETYPRMGQNQKRIDIANKNITKARLSWFEVFGLYYLYNPYATTTTESPRFLSGAFNGSQLGMTINLGQIVQKPNQIKIAKDELKITQLEYNEYYLTIEAIVKDRYFKYIEQQAIVKARSRSVLDIGVLMNTIRSKFEKGDETFENYSKALVLYNTENQSRINAESAMLSAKAFLEEILNKKLEEIQ
jgi:outer membrane protein TolC